MQVAIDTRTVDKDVLFRICLGRFACAFATQVLRAIEAHAVQHPLTSRILRWYDVRLFGARARLDVPTYGEASIQRQLDEASSALFGRSVAYETLQMAVTIIRSAVQLCAQVVVLWQVLGGQRDGMLLAGLTMSSQVINWLSQMRVFEPARGMFVRRLSAVIGF